MDTGWRGLLFRTPCLLLLFFPQDSLAGSHEDRLIKYLFRGYHPFSRPVQDEGDSVEVKFGITLQQIISLDEKEERLVVNIWLNYDWEDPRLTWNASAYGGISSVRIPYNYVWTPDILIYNSVDDEIDSKFPTNVVVSSNGHMNWIPIGIYSSACTVKIKWFPFDDQLCYLKFGSWTYDSTKINMTMQDTPIVISGYIESGEWKLIDTPHQRRVFCYDCCPEPYVDAKFYLHIRRRPLYYGFNLIIPGALVSSLALIIFCLPPDSNEKISLGINVLLTLAFNANIVADKIPSTSLEVPIIGVYFCCIEVLCTLSVVMTVLVINFHHRNPNMYEMPQWVRTFICVWLASILRIKRPGRDLSRERREFKRHQLNKRQQLMRQSKSLLSNIEAINHSFLEPNHVPHTAQENPFSVKIQNKSLDDLGICVSELSQILNGLRFITSKMKDNEAAAEEINDWKFAALVLDRLCLILFTGYTLTITAAIFLAGIFAPKGMAEPLPEVPNLVIPCNDTKY